MKKVYTLCIAALIFCMCSLKSNATMVTVSVQNFVFTPADFTINVGDTVMWMWMNGATSHTTTSTVIPAGAATWDHPMNVNSQMFVYIPTVAGSYDYHCTFHFTMGMVGHFSVSSATGFGAIMPVTAISLNVIAPVTNELQLVYSLPEATAVSIRMYNIIGNTITTFISLSQNAGTYAQTFALPRLCKGIYIVQLETLDARLSQKVLIR